MKNFPHHDYKLYLKWVMGKRQSYQWQLLVFKQGLLPFISSYPQFFSALLYLFILYFIQLHYTLCTSNLNFPVSCLGTYVSWFFSWWRISRCTAVTNNKVVEVLKTSSLKIVDEHSRRTSKYALLETNLWKAAAHYQQAVILCMQIHQQYWQ